jgi:hypothetical protein
MSLRAQNMKTGTDIPGAVENELGRAKHENRTRRPWYHQKWVRGRKTWKKDPTPSVPSKTSPGAQNIKTGPDALGTVENIKTWRPRYCKKWVWPRQTLKRDPKPSVLSKTNPCAQNMKTGPDTLSTVENESGRVKYENGTRRPLYRWKRVRKCKTWKRTLCP